MFVLTIKELQFVFVTFVMFNSLYVRRVCVDGQCLREEIQWLYGHVVRVSCGCICWQLCGSGHGPVVVVASGHMQSTTLLEPWPTSLIWLMWEAQTATPAPARQWDTEPTNSHLFMRGSKASTVFR